MFGWFKRRKQVDTFREQMFARMMAKYDAAQTNSENTRHWTNADNLGAASANSLGVRRKLRSRARYECANNCYANGMSRTLAYHAIGTGPSLSLEGDTPFDREVEDKWLAWADATKLADTLRVMREARVRDGESFGMLVTNEQIDSPVKLTLVPIECDRVSDPNAVSASGTLITADSQRNFADGISFDSAGNPISYNVLRDHPGDIWFSPVADTIAARYVVHWFRTDRPGQKRGIPEITPALPLYAILRRYTLAVLSTAEIAAMMSLFLKTTSPSVDVSSVDAWESINIERNAMVTLPDGWDVQQLRAEQPSTTHDSFVRTVLREIARCLDMPFNVAAGDSSSYNYSSGRLDHQTYFRAIDVDRSSCELNVLGPLFRMWFDDALLTPDFFREPRINLDKPRINWDWPPFEHVDPLKESNATSNDLSFGLTSIPTELARRGKRWDREWTKQARALGLTLEEYQTLMTQKLLAAPGQQSIQQVEVQGP